MPIYLRVQYIRTGYSTVLITKVFQKVIGKLSMTIFYYGIFTVHFRTKVHPRVPFHSPDLRKGCMSYHLTEILY